MALFQVHLLKSFFSGLQHQKLANHNLELVLREELEQIPFVKVLQLAFAFQVLVQLASTFQVQLAFEFLAQLSFAFQVLVQLASTFQVQLSFAFKARLVFTFLVK